MVLDLKGIFFLKDLLLNFRKPEKNNCFGFSYDITNKNITTKCISVEHLLQMAILI